jgi:hypothetical protein
MSLSLAQYAEQLDSRRDLSWPAAPEVQRTKSKPHLRSLPQVKAVTWNVYGTLLAVSGGHFTREHPQKFIMDMASGQDHPGVQDVEVDVTEAWATC